MTPAQPTTKQHWPNDSRKNGEFCEGEWKELRLNERIGNYLPIRIRNELFGVVLKLCWLDPPRPNEWYVRNLDHGWPAD